MIKEIRSTKIMEIEYSNNGEIAAHVCCIADRKKKECFLGSFLFETKHFMPVNLL